MGKTIQSFCPKLFCHNGLKLESRKRDSFIFKKIAQRIKKRPTDKAHRYLIKL